MLNSKGGGGASGWWNRRGSRIAVGDGDISTSSPMLPPSSELQLKDLEAQSSSDEEDEEVNLIVSTYFTILPIGFSKSTCREKLWSC